MQLVAYRNTANGIAAKKAAEQKSASVVSIMDAAMLRRREELKAELVSLVQQREATLAVIESHKEHVAELVKCRADMEGHMRKAASALTRFRGIEDKMVRTVPIDRIMRRMCRVFKVTRAELISAGRSSHVAFARHAICYWAARQTALSSSQIGRMLHRDHTTVLHGIRAYSAKRRAQGRTLREVR